MVEALITAVGLVDSIMDLHDKLKMHLSEKKAEYSVIIFEALVYSIDIVKEKHEIIYPSKRALKEFKEEVEGVLLQLDATNLENIKENAKDFIIKLCSRNYIKFKITVNKEEAINDLTKEFHNGFREIIINNERARNQYMLDAYAKQTALLVELSKKVEQLINERSSKEEADPKKVLITNHDLKDNSLIEESEGRFLDLSDSYQALIAILDWNSLKNSIDEFLTCVHTNEPYDLYLMSSFGIAFYVGIKLRAKYSYKINMIQNNYGTDEIWTYSPKLANKEYKLFDITEPIKKEKENDVVICITTGRDMLEDVKSHFEKNNDDIDSLIYFKLDAPGVEDSDHASALISQIKRKLDDIKVSDIRSLHFFFLSPISIASILGSISYDYKNIYFYDYVRDSGEYVKSFYIDKIES